MNAQDVFKTMQDEKIIFSFKGVVTKEILDSLYNSLGGENTADIKELKLRKRVNNILVEALQNIYHHTDKEGALTDNIHESICMVYRDSPESYRIITGNTILNSHIELLKNKLEELNAMKPEEVRELYQKKLAENELSAKGGAGLGLLDMARKSCNRMDYDFSMLNDEFSFFSLVISIS